MLRNLKSKYFLEGFSRLRNIYGIQSRSLFINPADDHVPTNTTADIISQIRAVQGGSNSYESIGYGEVNNANANARREKLMEFLPKDRTELPVRRMQDSFVTAIIPLRQNSQLRERYITFYGTLRVGRLLEEIDVFAAWSCYKHILNPRGEGKQNPFLLVTALVDRVNFSDSLMKVNEDIRLSAHVSWVGRSSMEVAVLVDQRDERQNWVKLTSAKFVFAARDPLNQGPVTVNPLVGETEAEKAFIKRGEERSRYRKLKAQESLELKPPTEEERELIHKLFISTLDQSYGGFRPSNRAINPPNSRFMEDSRVNTLLLCHPEHRNIFDKIFGGLIMRKAFELAFSNTYLYTKSRPSIISIDDIIFRKPVEIGALLRFDSEVAYVEDNYVHTPVIAEVLNPSTGESYVTNIFHFTFIAKSEKPLPNVIPNTYQEAMVYLNARRHFNLMKQCYLSNTSK